MKRFRKSRGLHPHRAADRDHHHRHPRRDRDPDVPQPARQGQGRRPSRKASTASRSASRATPSTTTTCIRPYGDQRAPWRPTSTTGRRTLGRTAQWPKRVRASRATTTTSGGGASTTFAADRLRQERQESSPFRDLSLTFLDGMRRPGAAAKRPPVVAFCHGAKSGGPKRDRAPSRIRACLANRLLGRVSVEAQRANHLRGWGAKPQDSRSRLGCRLRRLTSQPVVAGCEPRASVYGEPSAVEERTMIEHMRR